MNNVCIGIMAHVDAGKTTLSEAVLYRCEIIRRLGRVDKKDAFLDNYALERERGITIFSKQACFERNGVSFTLIDTPGHVDFSTEMERALSVLDVAVLVISGADGIQAHTRTLWKLLRLYDIPTVIFVNKMDREGTDRAELMKQLVGQFGRECVEFRFTQSGTLETESIEQAAMCDDEVTGRYLETEVLTADDIRMMIGERELFPCIFGSALKLEGVDELLDVLADYAPVAPPVDEFAARVFKITRAEDGTRLTHLKVTGGSLKNRDVLTYEAEQNGSAFTRAGLDVTAVGAGRHRVQAETDSAAAQEDETHAISEKVTQLRIYSGEKYTVTDCAEQGMIVAVAGLSATRPGQVMGAEEELFTPQLVPVMTYRVITADRSHLMQLVPKLKILEEEDPTLNVLWNPDVRELQLQVMGDIQLDIIKRSMADRFGEDVSFDRGSVLYRETISEPVLGVGHFEPLRHYAEVQLLLSPSETGSGISAESEVSVNDLELNWQRLIISHIFEREHKGVLTGAVLTDVHCSLVAGRASIKHTEGGDFRQATYRAIRQGLMRAAAQGSCVLLEPYYELNIEVPRAQCGRAMTDIEKRCGRLTSQYETGIDDMVGLTGLAPVATMQGYSKEVSAYTGGLGSVYCTFHGYLPCHNTDEVVAETGYEPEADLRNPASSVFCAHGAGFTVEWADVDSYKHLDWDAATGMTGDSAAPEQNAPVRFVSHTGDEPYMGTEEVDAIINRTAYGNRREQSHHNPFRRHRAGSLGTSRAGSSTGTTAAGSRAGNTATDSRAGNTGNTGTGSRTGNTYAGSRTMKEQYLLVDGYNIIFGWPELKSLAAMNIDGARERLNDILCNYQAVRGGSLIVVYDAYRVAGHPTEYFRHHNIGVVYTREAETADRFIERFAHENAKQYDITVATSDGLEQIIIRGAGCRLMTAADFAEDINRIRDELRLRLTDRPGQAAGLPIGTSVEAKLASAMKED